jgi:hypothetical protein
MAAILHQDQLTNDRIAFESLNTALDIGVVTATTIAADNTVAAFLLEFTPAVGASVHQDQLMALYRIGKGMAVAGWEGVITDALLNPLTTVAGLRALFTDSNPTITSATEEGSQYGE